MTRKLDSLVAEKVMGWVSSSYNPWGYPASRGPWWKTVPQRVYSLYETQHATNTPPFSASIDAAWEVVEKMKALDHFCQITVSGKCWDVECDMNVAFASASHTNVCTAICLAALRAVGVPESEITAAMEGER